MVDKGARTQGHTPGRRDLGYQFVFHTSNRQLGHVSSGGIMVLSVQAIGIRKMTVRHTKLLGLLVHLGDKSPHIAGTYPGQCQGGVISGLEQQPIQEGLQGDLFAYLQIHGGAFCKGVLPLNCDGLLEVCY